MKVSKKKLIEMVKEQLSSSDAYLVLDKAGLCYGIFSDKAAMRAAAMQYPNLGLRYFSFPLNGMNPDDPILDLNPSGATPIRFKR